MRFMIGLAVLMATLGDLHCSPEDEPNGISEDTLKQLSLDGARLLDEEVRKALYGVKQMREVMLSNQEKHQHLMTSVRHSGDKKKGAAQLSQEVAERLAEAEEQCKMSLQAEWEQCRPCLQDACNTFYTASCRRGFSAFHTKVENFFHRVSSRFSPPSHGPPPESPDPEVFLVTQSPESPDPEVFLVTQSPESPDPEVFLVTQSPESTDPEVVGIENSFNRLLTKVGSLCSRSAALVSRIQNKLDAALQKAFSPNAKEQVEPTSDHLSPSHDSAFLQGVGLEEVLDSFFDFGKSVVEEFGAVVTQVFDDLNDAEGKKKRERAVLPRFLRNRKLCRDLRRQTSECWQLQNRCEACQGALLTECPGVRELHVELDKVSQLLQVSKEQYGEILAIARRHTDHTVSWLSNMASDFSWVAELADATLAPETVFRITAVSEGSDGESTSGAETKVEVNILNSSPMLLWVPAGLEVQDPAFIQHVALEALDMYKQRVRDQDDSASGTEATLFPG